MRLGSVQQKIPCVFVTEVKQEPSRKRDCQFQVVATESVSPVAVVAQVHHAVATEKLDGTCCYVSVYKGRPHLWARLDRKPNKQADKRFKKHQRSHHSCKGFLWSVEEDFKPVPETWVPALGVKHHSGQPVPDEHGHIPGWVPVEKDNKQYCWHASVLDPDLRAALVLRPSAEDGDALEVVPLPLADLLERTLELIGTNVNGNPYGLGSKKTPVHLLVSHGALRIRDPPPVDFQQLCSWFRESPEGRVEGIVWHCHDGTLFKVHRHHLGLRWPEGDPSLGERAVVVAVGSGDNVFRSGGGVVVRKDSFALFSALSGRRFSRLMDITFTL
ncbi:RNA ligase 1 isoform X2 [Gasterosteus aculeatus]|uniref:uncharacterized protein C12orf29 homolog isoform X2 n=1 Tax=Gasterosteus aculeatus aculeatus TaxID=481459 RepID=UPI001A994B8C|nr:uncharacterized protein C12orf29 homolog isoform X2 [Gasterosteus aculeatus aculeatus]